MRRLWLVFALTGCSSVAGLDGYCLLEDDAPPAAPCRAAPVSCGCPAGETCRAFTTGDSERRECGPVGPLGANQPCDSISSCGETMTCWGWSAVEAFHCRSFCEDDADCERRQGPGSICVDHGLTFRVCSKPCTPGQDDLDCASGLACDTTRGVGFCRLEGSAGFGEPCDSSTLCQRGLACRNSTTLDADICFRICGPGMGCAEGECVVSLNDGVRPATASEWGVCAVQTD